MVLQRGSIKNIRFRILSYDPGRIPDNHAVRWYILGDHTGRPNNGTFADLHPAYDYSVGAYPHVVFDDGEPRFTMIAGDFVLSADYNSIEQCNI